MSSRYARLPTSDRHSNHDIDDEVQAAFDYREDDDDEHNSSESQPLNPNANASQAPSTRPVLPQITTTTTPTTNSNGTYNFESVDYDFPPPGSPPPPSAVALPNNYGNTNGLVPDFATTPISRPRPPWWQRAASVLPQNVTQRLGINQRPSGAVGSGTNNDGVFANVTAKPSPPVRVQNDDGTYVVPEDSQQEAPPSYASAQADAVPPYWETTVHAPFSPDSLGEMIVDSLPTGSLFSFCWNMLVSISFQFVGFLLTYLLHTSHAARLGSRAGLGVTLIQYGFALRGRMDDADSSEAWSGWQPPAEPHPTFATLQEAEAWYQAHNATSTLAEEQAAFLADATTEWLSFFLMTIGWFVLLTSVLGFYRVKRWERGILASQQQNSSSSATTEAVVANDFERNFAIRGMSRIEFLRNGFAFNHSRNDEDQTVAQLEEGNANRGQDNDRDDARETDAMIPPDPNDPRQIRAAAVLERERRLRSDLREAGLL